MEKSNHNIVARIDQFINKYYKNMLLKGMLLLASLATAFYLLVTLAEYFFYFNTIIRTAIFFGYLGLSIVFLVYYIIVPILQLYRIRAGINYEQAARIIGAHFPEVGDKLLNTLQLIQSKEIIDDDKDLLNAAINQKTNQLTVTKFTKAVNYSHNQRYLKYLLPPILAILLIFFLSPKLVSEPTRRILNFNKSYFKPLPYRILLLTKELKAIHNENFKINIKVLGEETPKEVYLVTGGNKFKLHWEGGDDYSFLFKVVQRDTEFRLEAGKLVTEPYTLRVFPRPTILEFKIALKYPEYTHRLEETVSNTGDISVPAGTKVCWEFITNDVDRLNFFYHGVIKLDMLRDDNVFRGEMKMVSDLDYFVVPENEFSDLRDTLRYSVNVIKDRYPMISYFERDDDSLRKSKRMFVEIRDDYGFTKLHLLYEFYSNEDSINLDIVKEEIYVDKEKLHQLFDLSDRIELLQGMMEMNIRYSFEVFDNDGVEGPKMARTDWAVKRHLTQEESIQLEAEENERLLNSMKQSMNEAQSTIKEIEELEKTMVQEPGLGWEQNIKAQQIIKSAEKILDVLQEQKRSLENSYNLEREISTESDIIMKKRELEAVLNQFDDKEVRRLTKELKDVLSKLDEKKMAKLLNEMERSIEEINTSLERNFELLKEIQFKEELERIIKNLRNLAKEQEDLLNGASEKNRSREDELNKQREISEKFDGIKAKTDSLLHGEEIEKQKLAQESKSRADSIKSSLDKSLNGIEKNERRSAQRNQKRAQQQMQNMAERMEELQNEIEEDELAEDSENIRMILENLLRLSFLQESLVRDTKAIPKNDPRYAKLVYKQSDIKVQMQIINDSLREIARRQVFIQSMVTREIEKIDQSVVEAINNLNSRNLGGAMTKQQEVMMGINNLAILLAESLDKMNQKMQMNLQSKGGSKSCSRPKSQGGKTSITKMRDTQSRINRQIEEMKKGDGQGKRSGKSKGGKETGDKLLNQQIARMVMEQEALRNAVNEYLEKGEGGNENSNKSLQKMVQMMEETERDLLNRRVTAETLRRQKDIETRLLEAERAEQRRELEYNRSSVEGKNTNNGNFNPFLQYKKNTAGSIDLIKYSDPPVNKYYREKTDSYIVKIGKSYEK